MVYSLVVLRYDAIKIKMFKTQVEQVSGLTATLWLIKVTRKNLVEGQPRNTFSLYPIFVLVKHDSYISCKRSYLCALKGDDLYSKEQNQNCEPNKLVKIKVSQDLVFYCVQFELNRLKVGV